MNDRIFKAASLQSIRTTVAHLHSRIYDAAKVTDSAFSITSWIYYIRNLQNFEIYEQRFSKTLPIDCSRVDLLGL